MEEETSEEWEIEKHGSDGGNRKRSMIWRVGKKLVMGGVMITSAPFLLPPLIVVSTVGFAFSLPFGLVFAGYACTEKVMSKLLSRPRVEDNKDGLELESEGEECEEDVKKRLELSGGGYGAGEEDQYEQSMEETDEMMEDRGYEEDCSVDEEHQKGIQLERSEKSNQGTDGMMDYVEPDLKEVVEDEGEEEIGRLVVEESVGGINDKEEGKSVGEIKGSKGDESAEHRDIPVEGVFYDKIEEGEESAVEKVGVVQEYEGEENVDNIEEERHLDEEVDIAVEETTGSMGEEIKNLVGEAEGGDKENVYSLDVPRRNEEVKTEESGVDFEGEGNEVNGAISVQNDEPFGAVMEGVDENEYKEIEEEETLMDEEASTPVKEPIGSMGEEIKKLAGDSEGGDQEATDAYSLDKPIANEAVPIKESGVGFDEEKNEVNEAFSVQDEEPIKEGVGENGVVDKKLEPIQVKGMVEDSIVDRMIDEKVEEANAAVDTKEMIQERARKSEDNIASDDVACIEGKEVTVIPIKEEVKPIPIKENAGEIADESGLDLFDVETAALEQGNFVTDENEVSPAADYISQSVEFNSVPRHVRLDFSSAIEEHPSDGLSAESVDSAVNPVSPKIVDTQPAKVLLEMETATPVKEVQYTEERIWELMNAMRKIVGYGGAVQPNIAEELKALYTFTGVEPPVVLKDPLDLVEANDKLRLLMAIVGVK